MTEPIEQHITPARSVCLTDAERTGMRRTLEAYSASYRPPVSAWSFFARHALASSFVAALLLVGGTSAVAERSGPDDALYDIRIAFNDRIGVLVSGDQEAQLDTELRQLERMLDDEEYALDGEIAQLSAGIDDDEQDDTDSGDTDDVEGVSGTETSRPSPIRFDDGADTELDILLRDLDSAARETPDVGE
jgi:hypothetical protein